MDDTSDLKTGTEVATLPDVLHYGVNHRTGWPSVRIFQLDQIAKTFLQLLLITVAHSYCHRRSVSQIFCWAVKQPARKQTNNPVHL